MAQVTQTQYESLSQLTINVPAPEREQEDGTSPGYPRRASGRTDSLPKLQLFILCVIRLCEPISFTVIFPMVAFMIAEFEPSLSEKEIGFYSGAIESIFSFSQFLTIILWGKLSDWIGRKPVLLIGLVGVSISTVVFGFSKGFWSMMFARAIGGILNGNAAVIKSMVGEITTHNNQALAFSYLPTCFAVGSTIGPLLGGYLSRPANRFPHSWFARSPFWQDHPWLLPCVVAGIAPFAGFLMAVAWLEETLPEKRSIHLERQPLLQADPDTVDQPHVSDSDPIPPPDPRKNVFNLLQDRNLVHILFNYSLLSFQTIALEALIVLFAYTPIRSGGIQFSAADIGVALSASGLLTLIVQLGLFPTLQKHYGTVKLYRICMSSYPVIFLLFPLVHFIAVAESQLKNPHFIGVWTGLAIILVLKTSANMVFSCNMLLVNSAAPTRDMLGTINGLAQCCASFVRAVGPLTASSLFAVSVMHQKVIDGTSVFVLFAALASVASVTSWMIREGGERWRDA